MLHSSTSLPSLRWDPCLAAGSCRPCRGVQLRLICPVLWTSALVLAALRPVLRTVPCSMSRRGPACLGFGVGTPVIAGGASVIAVGSSMVFDHACHGMPRHGREGLASEPGPVILSAPCAIRASCVPLLAPCLYHIPSRARVLFEPGLGPEPSEIGFSFGPQTLDLGVGTPGSGGRDPESGPR